MVLFYGFEKTSKHVLFLLTRFGSGFAGSVHGHFYRLRIRGDLVVGRAANDDGDAEGFSAAAAAHEAQVVEFGHLVLHEGGIVSQFAVAIFVVAGFDGHLRVVRDVVERDYFESYRQTFIGAPVRGQRAAEYGGTSGLHELSVISLKRLLHGCVYIRHFCAGGQMHLYKLKIKRYRTGATTLVIQT